MLLWLTPELAPDLQVTTLVMGERFLIASGKYFAQEWRSPTTALQLDMGLRTPEMWQVEGYWAALAHMMVTVPPKSLSSH